MSRYYQTADVPVIDNAMSKVPFNEMASLLQMKEKEYAENLSALPKDFTLDYHELDKSIAQNTLKTVNDEIAELQDLMISDKANTNKYIPQIKALQRKVLGIQNTVGKELKDRKDFHTKNLEALQKEQGKKGFAHLENLGIPYYKALATQGVDPNTQLSNMPNFSMLERPDVTQYLVDMLRKDAGWEKTTKWKRGNFEEIKEGLLSEKGFTPEKLQEKITGLIQANPAILNSLQQELEVRTALGEEITMEDLIKPYYQGAGLLTSKTTVRDESSKVKTRTGEARDAAVADAASLIIDQVNHPIDIEQNRAVVIGADGKPVTNNLQSYTNLANSLLNQTKAVEVVAQDLYRGFNITPDLTKSPEQNIIKNVTDPGDLSAALQRLEQARFTANVARVRLEGLSQYVRLENESDGKGGTKKVAKALKTKDNVPVKTFSQYVNDNTAVTKEETLKAGKTEATSVARTLGDNAKIDPVSLNGQNYTITSEGRTLPLHVVNNSNSKNFQLLESATATRPAIGKLNDGTQVYVVNVGNRSAMPFNEFLAMVDKWETKETQKTGTTATTTTDRGYTVGKTVSRDSKDRALTSKTKINHDTAQFTSEGTLVQNVRIGDKDGVVKFVDDRVVPPLSVQRVVEQTQTERALKAKNIHVSPSAVSQGFFKTNLSPVSGTVVYNNIPYQVQVDDKGLIRINGQGQLTGRPEVMQVLYMLLTQ